MAFLEVFHFPNAASVGAKNDSILDSRELFGNDQAPFAITLAGQKFYIVISPEDVTTVYRNSTSLTFDAFITHVLGAVGVSSSGLEKLWARPTQSDWFGEDTNALCKPMTHLARDLHRQQLLPGPKLDGLTQLVLCSIRGSLDWDGAIETKQISLMGWCGEVLIGGTIKAMFGDRLLQIEPELRSIFMDFNEDAWMLLFKYPRLAAPRMYAARDRIIHSLSEYSRSSPEELLDESYLVQVVRAKAKEFKIGERDYARMVFILLWAANANAYRLAFWMFVHLAFDNALLTAVRDETRPAIQNGHLNISYLLECCPRIDSLFYEVLRFTSGAASTRTVLSPTIVGGKKLRAGAQVLIPIRQLNLNKDVFGDNTHEFDAERFLQRKGLSQNVGFRPFGGGTTLCPGRFLAKQEVLAFVALTLQRFDIELALVDKGDGKGFSPQSFPRLDDRTPNVGVFSPIKGNSVILNLQKRD
ncbi:hypothetical protein MMC30_001525 [Trapelia coarctata]|nr:hypothetical protein [Trapelia coarctata]